jgi:hypothetical protein
MNNYNRIKDRIINEGCYIEAETYKNGVTIHSLIKRENENTKTIFCEIAANIARMLEVETGKAIIQKDGLTVALNFIPIPVKHNMVRTFHYKDTEERLFN